MFFLNFSKPTIAIIAALSLQRFNGGKIGSNFSSKLNCSGSGDEKVRGRKMSWDRSSENKKGRSRSSDVRAGKFLNKLRGQKFSNLKPEMYHNKKSPLTESGTNIVM